MQMRLLNSSLVDCFTTLSVARQHGVRWKKFRWTAMDLIESDHGLTEYCPGIFLQGLSKTTKYLGQNSWDPCWQSNRTPAGYRLECYRYANPLGTKFTWNVIQANMASVALAACIREFRTNNKCCMKTDAQVSFTIWLFRSLIEAGLHFTDWGNSDHTLPHRTISQPVELLALCSQVLDGRSVTLYACACFLGPSLLLLLLLLLLQLRRDPLKWSPLGTRQEPDQRTFRNAGVQYVTAPKQVTVTRCVSVVTRF
jgi:hypothetical protein